jgi:hypothetical protein
MSKSTLFWALEFRQNGQTTGYLKDVKTDGGYDAELSRTVHDALHFDSKEGASVILNDTAFQHALGHLDWAIEEHMNINVDSNNADEFIS